MTEVLSLLVVLQILLNSGSTQPSISQRDDISKDERAYSSYWPYQAIVNGYEIQYKRVKPCLTRKMFRDSNQGLSNVNRFSIYKTSDSKTSGQEFVSQSFKENGYVGNPNAHLRTNSDNVIINTNLNTLTVSPIYLDKPIGKNNKEKKDQQNILRRAIPESIETKEKQMTSRSLNKKTIAQPYSAEISYECSEKKNLGQSRRSDSNYENPLYKINNNKNKNISQNNNNAITNYYGNRKEKIYFNNEKLEQGKIYGASKMADSSVMLMQNSRTCYACSSASDPSCWHPDRKTIVKYCHEGHDACLTRTFKSSREVVLTRDCGRTCEDLNFQGEEPSYKSCSICHYDLCNGACCVQKHIFLFIIVLFTLMKYSLL